MWNLVIGVVIGLLVGASIAHGEVGSYYSGAKWISDNPDPNDRRTPALMNKAFQIGYTAGVIDTINAISSFDKDADSHQKGHMDIVQLQARMENCMARSNIMALGDIQDFADRAVRTSPVPTYAAAALSIMGAFSNCGR